MNDITRAEIDARLEANEARREAQTATIHGKIDAVVIRLEGLAQSLGNQSQRMDRLEHSISAMADTVAGLKSTVIITGITSVIAIVLGMAGFNAALLSNMTATFESGKNTAEMQHETRRQVQETATLLKKMQERYDKQAAHD
jgi:hypothetical protein